jgi:hypothetical protein
LQGEAAEDAIPPQNPQEQPQVHSKQPQNGPDLDRRLNEQQLMPKSEEVPACCSHDMVELEASGHGQQSDAQGTESRSPCWPQEVRQQFPNASSSHARGGRNGGMPDI